MASIPTSYSQLIVKTGEQSGSFTVPSGTANLWNNRTVVPNVDFCGDFRIEFIPDFDGNIPWMFGVDEVGGIRPVNEWQWMEQGFYLLNRADGFNYGTRTLFNGALTFYGNGIFGSGNGAMNGLSFVIERVGNTITWTADGTLIRTETDAVVDCVEITSNQYYSAGFWNGTGNLQVNYVGQ